MKTQLLNLFFLLFFSAGLVQTQAQTISHVSWDALLQKNVSADGQVNYEAFKQEEKALKNYLTSLEKGLASNASKAEAMAYWINAYNAFTIKLILDHYPVKSIRNIRGGKAWDYTFINIQGKKYSLNDIEHKILRKKYFDSRLHFALVCAAQSCPKLANKAYTKDNLYALLSAQAKAFINNPAKNTLKTNSAEISELFNWYKEDFLRVKGIDTIIDYLNKYADVKVNDKASIKYKTYNWALND